MVRCCVCAHWYHMKCLKLVRADISAVWPCFKCRNMVLDIRSANDKIDLLTELIRTLVTSMEGNCDDLRIIQSQYAQIEEDNKISKRKNEALETEVKDLKQWLNSTEHQTRTAKKTLVLGSSLVRNFDEQKLQDTEVFFLRGAKVTDLAKELQLVRSSPRTYSYIPLLGGGNDASLDEEHVGLGTSDLTVQTMVNTAKEILDDMYCGHPTTITTNSSPWKYHDPECKLAGLIPGIKGALYRQPKPLCVCNGEVNDGYLYDNAYLNIKGANKLVHSIGSQRKQ